MNDGTCCVCFGEYNDVNCIPVVSSCGHTVCRNCSSSLKKLNNSSNVHCPTCRTLVPYPMPTNFSLISILTSMKSSLSSRHQHPSSNNIQQFTYDEIQKTIKNSIFLDENLQFETRKCFLRGRFVTIKYLSSHGKYLLESDGLFDKFEVIFKSQCSLLAELSHPNIVKYFGYSITSNPAECIIVSEYLPGGTLYHRLFEVEKCEDILLSTQRIALAIDIAKAIAYQHGIHITDWSFEEVLEMKSNLSQYEADTKNNQTNIRVTYHKDIRSMNILLSGDLTGKLRNTTLDQLVDEMVSDGLDLMTNGYTAPEVKEHQYFIQSEIYSFGAILFELLCTQPADKLMPLISPPAQELDPSDFSQFISSNFEENLRVADWKPNEIEKLCKIGQECIFFNIQARPSSMRIILLALLQLQYEMVGCVCALESSENHLQNINSAFSFPITSPPSSSAEPIPSQVPTVTRFHTGHYRRYYGGPTNGRWSCCESYDRDAEGCHQGVQVRHHPDRNKLWGEGYNWNCCGQPRTAPGCVVGPQVDQFLLPPSSTVIPQSPPPLPPPSQATTRYHTGHYRRYYGGPTNGRWSCCESYDRDAEGCHQGVQVRHHPDRNKLWGEGYNWNCCGRERTADGCKAGLQPDQYLVEARVVSSPTSQPSPRAQALPSPAPSTNNNNLPVRYHPGHYRRYYGGPTNGRWSCCESYDRDAEGCHQGVQVRHHPDRNKLWGEGYNWNCCGQARTADGCVVGPPSDQIMANPTTPTTQTPPQSPTADPLTPSASPSSTPTARYHTGHYKPYYGGPTNGRWSCCESYDRDAEGCHQGSQIRHHPDFNKLWGEGYNWNCCGRERTADGCKAGPQVGQYLIDPPFEVSYHPGNYRAYVGGPSSGRWSCCENFNKNSEGCHKGPHPRHHTDLNKFWGAQHNWACCGQPRSADGCTMGPHPHPIHPDTRSKPSRSRNNSRNSSGTRRVVPSIDPNTQPPSRSPTRPAPSSHPSLTLQTLLSMGFPEREAQEAVSRSQTLEEAIEYITNHSS